MGRNKGDGTVTTTAEPRVTLGDLIKRARLDKGWDQARLAKEVGCSRASIGHWERDRNQPTFGDMLRVIKATGAEWLLTEPFKDGRDIRTGWSAESAGQALAMSAA